MSELKFGRRRTREETTRHAQLGSAEHEAHSGASRQLRISVLLSSRLARVGVATLLFFAAYLSTFDRILQPLGPGTASAADTVIVSYVGLNSVHLLLDYTAGCEYGYACDIRLMVNSQAGPLATKSNGWSPPQPFLHTAANGTYRYRFESVNTLAGFTTIINTSPWTDWVTVDRHTVGGTLLFPETLSGDVVPGGIVTCNGGINVPLGTSLTLSGVITAVSGSPYCDITVAGTLDLGQEANTAAIGVVLNSPQTFVHISNANLTFAAGSGGSAVSNSHDFSLAANAFGGSHIDVSDSMSVTLGLLDLSGGSELRLTKVASTGGDLQVQGQGMLAVEEGTFEGNVNISKTQDDDIQIKTTRFRGAVTVFSDASATKPIIIEGSHFAMDVTLLYRTPVRFTGNVFVGALLFSDSSGGWCDATTPEPAIRDNSFTGKIAMNFVGAGYPCETKIAIGANYYGDQAGYTGNDAPYLREFLRRGSGVNTYGLAPVAANPSGPTMIDTGVFPQVWLNAYRIGQGTFAQFGGQPAQGKETLLSLDLVSSGPTVNGVKVWAVFDGQTVDPTTGRSVVLHRDTKDYGSNANFYAKSTVDFILPAVSNISATLEVWLDTRGVTGYDVSGGALVRLGEPPPVIQFAAPPARKLKIVVVPIQLGVAGPLASVGSLPASLPAMMAAMFPITKDAIEVRVRIPALWDSPV